MQVHKAKKAKVDEFARDFDGEIKEIKAGVQKAIDKQGNLEKTHKFLHKKLMGELGSMSSNIKAHHK